MMRSARLGFYPYLWAEIRQEEPAGALGSPRSHGLVDIRFRSGCPTAPESPAGSRAFRKLLTSLLPWPGGPCGFRLCAHVPPTPRLSGVWVGLGGPRGFHPARPVNR